MIDTTNLTQLENLNNLPEQNFSGIGSGFTDLLGSIGQIQSGAKIAQQGAEYSASSLRVAGASALDAARYNAAIVGANLITTLGVLGRDIRKTTGMQRAQAASTGFDLASGSTLSIFNDTLDQYQREIIGQKNQAQQKQTSILFEGASQQAMYENQARAALYQGDIAQYNADQQTAKGIGGLFSNLGSLL